jgi:hypothetical protein
MASLSNYYYFPHVSKEQYNRAFNRAREWALENPKQQLTAAARIYHVKEDSLHKSVLRSKTKQRNPKGLYNRHGGNNKILNEA